MEKTWLKIKSWIKANPKEFWILVFILVIAAFCRLYRIDQYMTFLGDEGRDVIIVRRLLVEGHPPLIGPGTSVGQVYLGPLYYYMMAPALWLANFSPVGPAVEIAILGVITVGFVWWVGRKWFGSLAGIIAAALYAVSPTVIIYSRSSWNPNIMPLFAILAIYSLWKIWNEKKFGWLAILGVSYAFVLQSHYLGLFLAPTILLFWILTIRNLKIKKNFLINSLIGIGSFLILMSPLLIFDLRHNFQNLKAFETLFAARGNTVSFNVNRAISNIPTVFNQINLTLLTAKNMLAGIVVSVVTVLIWVFTAVRKKLKSGDSYLILLSWIGFGVLGFVFYKLPIFDHYFGFLFPAPFLLVGGLAENIQRGASKTVKILVFVLCFALLILSLLGSPLRKEPNRLLERSQDVSRKIVDEAGGTPMNLAVLADSNYEAGYQYFVELYGGRVLEIDATNPTTFANQLFVVCELLPTTRCDPTHSPKAQVANFGWSKIDTQWPVDGVIIYRLLHSK